MVSRLERLYAKAAAGEPEGIHQARVTARRWAAACKLLAGALGKKRAARMARSARKCARALADVRALDVCLEIARKEHAGPWLIRELERLREKNHRAARRVLESGRCRRLFQGLRRDIAACGTPEKPPKTAVKILRKYAKEWDKRRRAAQAALHSGDRWHRLRIAGKKWRYVLEASHDLGFLPSPEPAKTLKKLQSALGAAHDEEVLRELIRIIARGKGTEVQREARTLVKKSDKRIKESRKAAQGMIPAVVSGLRNKK